MADPRIQELQRFLQALLEGDGAWTPPTGAVDEIDRLANAVRLLAQRFEEERKLRRQESRNLREMREALATQAVHDPLTGAWNREAILEVYRKAFIYFQRGGGWLAVALAGMDRFEEVNETFGRKGGDDVLRAVAQRIGAVLRGCDYVGRYGGDEFLILLGECDERGAKIVAERIGKVIRFAPVDANGAKLTVTVSLGVVLLAHVEEASPEKLLSLAEQALREAKEGGRDRIVMVP
jgi:diguanylate cyclase (GGDEF)-like protein